MVDLGYAALVQRSDLQEGEVWRVSRCIKCAGARQAVVDLTPMWPPRNIVRALQHWPQLVL